jgi:hypothetical protein
MKLNNILKIALIAPFLVACGESDEFDGNAGGVATFSATIDGVSTRATDTSWAANDSIGISVDSENSATEGSNVKYITAAGDGTFTTAATPITFGDKNKVNFKAYYPYTAASNIDSNGNISVSTVIANQGASIDYMYATGNGSSTKPNVKLSFSHKMSQVVLNFMAGNGITDFSGSNLKFTLSGIVQSGTFNTTKGEATATSGAKAEDITVTPASTAYSSDNKTVSQSLIFLPQDVNTIDLELTIGETTYTATLSLPAVDNEQGLLAGRSVSYDITVNKSSLNASNGTIVGWTKDEGSFASGKLGTHMADEAQLYDLAFSDGSFVSVWPEGVSRTESLSDENLEILQTNIYNLTILQRAYLVGIVYWKGDPAKDDGLLQTDYPDCKHGLILALKDMSKTDVQWILYEEYYSVSDAIDKWDSDLKPVSDNTILIEYDGTQNADNANNVKQLNKALGYNNTKLLRAYNYYRSDADHKVHPIEYLDSFADKNDAPKGSSGWYLPSPKELVLTLEDNSSIEFYTGKSATDQINNIQKILDLDALNASKMREDLYWSSSECKYTYVSFSDDRITFGYNVWRVNFSGNEYGNVIDYSGYGNSYLRAVCAF